MKKQKKWFKQSRKDRICDLCNEKIKIGDLYLEITYMLSQFDHCHLYEEPVKFNFCSNHGFVKKETAREIWLNKK